ncbi:hypothetical protein ZHAS_00008737 [Anopheles sinensis]|uniref:Uncharacterized protein n=1 Tax=Anopheles sinensis TaxID=74873 RepID=A0A084VT81_ANOSI|nr:hypothetical protein ZHAS_00008737 [Anopheles sinensis]
MRPTRSTFHGSGHRCSCRGAKVHRYFNTGNTDCVLFTFGNRDYFTDCTGGLCPSQSCLPVFFLPFFQLSFTRLTLFRTCSAEKCSQQLRRSVSTLIYFQRARGDIVKIIKSLKAEKAFDLTSYPSIDRRTLCKLCVFCVLLGTTKTLQANQPRYGFMAATCTDQCTIDTLDRLRGCGNHQNLTLSREDVSLTSLSTKSNVNESTVHDSAEPDGSSRENSD